MFLILQSIGVHTTAKVRSSMDTEIQVSQNGLGQTVLWTLLTDNPKVSIKLQFLKDFSYWAGKVSIELTRSTSFFFVSIELPRSNSFMDTPNENEF